MMFSDPKTVKAFFLCKEQMQLNTRLMALQVREFNGLTSSEKCEVEIIQKRLKEIGAHLVYLT